MVSEPATIQIFGRPCVPFESLSRKKRAPAQMGDEPGLEVTLDEPRGRRENLAKATMFLARQNPLGQQTSTVQGSIRCTPIVRNVAARAAGAGRDRTLRPSARCVKQATGRGDLGLGWEHLCCARLVFCGDGLGPTRQKPVRKPQHHHAPRPDAGASTGRGFKDGSQCQYGFGRSAGGRPRVRHFCALGAGLFPIAMAYVGEWPLPSVTGAR